MPYNSAIKKHATFATFLYECYMKIVKRGALVYYIEGLHIFQPTFFKLTNQHMPLNLMSIDWLDFIIYECM